MTKVVIDSSVYISYYGSDIHSPLAKKFFKSNSQLIYVVTPTLVIAETLTILAKQNFPHLETITQTLLRTEVINLDAQFLKSLTSHLSSSRGQSLRASDLIIALTAKSTNATLITWDKQLLSQTLCPVSTPEKFK